MAIETLASTALAVVAPQAVDQDAMSRAADLFAEGSIQFEAANYPGAIEKFTEALGIVSSIRGDDRTRLMLLYNIAAAHEKQFAVDREISHLRQALELYGRYEEFAKATGDLDEESDVAARIASLEKKLRAHDQIERDRAEADDHGGRPPPTGGRGDERDWKRPRNVGIALTVAGGAVAIGGAVMAVLGSRFEANAQAQVDDLADLGIPPDDPAWAQGEAFVADEKKKGDALMGVGISAAVVGIVGVVVGVYDLARSKKIRARQLGASPTFSPGLVTFEIRGRF